MKNKKDTKQNLIEGIKKAFHFFDDSEDRVWVVDSNLHLIYGNSLFQSYASKIMGDSIPVGGYVFNDKVPEFYQKEWKGYFKRAFNGESFHVEVAVTLTPKEEIIDYLFSPLRDEKADIFAVMISGRTVSASKHLETKLLKNEKLLSKAEEIADFGTWEFDLNANLVTASTGARKIYGLSSEQWTIKDVQKIPLPEYREALDLAMVNLIKYGEAYDLQFKIKRPTDHDIRDIHSRANYDSSKNSVFGVIHDITEQKKKENELFKAGILFKKIWDSSTEGMRLTDSEGLIVRVNSAFSKMFGKTEEEIIGKPLSELYDSGSGCKILSAYKEKVRGKNIATHIEKEFTLWNGKKIWFSVSFSTFTTDSSGFLVLSSFRDNTDKKRYEQELNMRKERYESLVQTSIDGFLAISIDGRILESNEAYQKMSGYSNSELLKMRISDLEEYESMDQTAKHMVELFSKKWDRYETRHRKKDGTTFDLEVNTSYLASQNIFLTFLSDITGRKSTEEELIKNREELKSYFDHSPYGIYIVNETGKYLEVNEIGAKLYEHSREEFLNLSIKDILPEESVEAGLRHFAKVKSEGFAEEEILMKKKNGETFIGFIIAVSLTGNKFMGFCLDVTKRREMEIQLKKTEERLRLALEASNDGLWDWNFQTGELYWSPRAFTMLGYEPNEFLPSLEKWLELLHPEDRDKTWEEVKKQTNLGDKFFRIEFRFKTKFNGWLWSLARGKAVEFNSDGSPKRMIGTYTDISDLKDAEDALKMSEERYRTIIAKAPFGIFLIRNGKYIFANMSGLSMLGLQSIEQLMNMNAEDTVYSKDNEKIKSRISQAINGQSNPPIELEIKRTDGKLLISESTSIPIELPDGPAIMIMGSDITERKLAEEALKNQEEKLSSIFRAAPIGIGVVINRVIKEANNSLLAMTGYSLEELKNQPARMLYLNDEDYDYVGREKYEQISKKGTGTVETRWRRKEGRIIDIILSSTPLDVSDLSKGVTFSAMDITERKKIERALAHNEKLLLAIAKATKELLTNKDTDKAIGKSLSLLGHATGVDRAYFFETSLNDSAELSTFSQKYEWSSDQTVAQINNPELQNVPFLENMEFIEPLSGGGVFNHLVKNLPECRTKKALLAQNIVSILVLPVFVRNQFYGFVGFDDCHNERIWSDSEFTLLSAFSDSVAKAIERKMTETDLEKTLQELKDTQKQILLQERLRSLGQMTSGICHDINNSLTPIMGYIDILRDDEELMGRYGRAFNMIIKSTEDIAHTIGRLKEFYKLKLSAEELVESNINKLLRDSIELTRHRWKNIPESTGSVIEIIETYDPNLPLVTVDESELREAVMNLILNSCDAMPKGGKLYLTTIAQKENVIIEIKDTGIGMKEETLAHCFDPFYSTKGEKGTGLGLSMVYGIIERHKGKIQIESEFGHGTAVSLILPVNREKKEDKALSGLTNSIKPLKILYIEDEDSIAEMIKHILERRNHSVTLSNNGKKGLEVYLENLKTENSFDLVITDLGMAEMDGISVSKQIKKITPDIPIILFTGWGSLINHEEIETVDYLLKKPVTKETLFKAIYSLFH